jgi:membrane-bound inhibitor of C-type lysozyme
MTNKWCISSNSCGQRIESRAWVAAALYRGSWCCARMIGRKWGVLLGLALAMTLVRGAMVPSDARAADLSVVYRCADGARMGARFIGMERAVLKLRDGNRVLRNTRAASGSRYEGNGIVFWIKGDEATLDQPGGHSTTCRVAR